MRPLGPPSTAKGLTRATRRTANLERRFPAVRFMPVVFDGLGSVLTAGIKGDVAVHFDAIILRWRLLADQPGDLIVDIWRTDYAGFPPTVTDSITAASQPTLSGSDKDEDTALIGWDTQLFDGDTLRFNIDSAATVTRVTLLLTLAA